MAGGATGDLGQLSRGGTPSAKGEQRERHRSAERTSVIIEKSKLAILELCLNLEN